MIPILQSVYDYLSKSCFSEFWKICWILQFQGKTNQQNFFFKHPRTPYCFTEFPFFYSSFNSSSFNIILFPKIFKLSLWLLSSLVKIQNFEKKSQHHKSPIREECSQIDGRTFRSIRLLVLMILSSLLSSIDKKRFFFERRKFTKIWKGREGRIFDRAGPICRCLVDSEASKKS